MLYKLLSASEGDHYSSQAIVQDTDSHDLIQLQRPRSKRISLQFGTRDGRKVSLLLEDRL